MDFDIDYFLKINNANRTTSKKDVALYNLKSQINNNFDGTIDFYRVVKNNYKLKESQDLLVIRTTDDYKKTIKARPDEDFEVGDFFTWENNDWLVISKDIGNQVYTSGIMQLCNYTLTFQSSNGTILSYPCIKETSSSVGINEGSVITTPDSVVTIKLPFDSETKLLDVDRRFFIDDLTVETPQVFAVSKPDRTTTKGIIKLTMKQGAYNKDVDNKELGVCNYYSSTIPQPTGSGYSVISISGDLCIGATRVISAKFYEADGTENTNITANWNVILPSGLEGYFDVQPNGNTCTVTVNDDDYVTIDNIVTVNVDDGSGGYAGTKSITVVA